MIEPNGTLSRPGSRSFCRSTAMKSHIVPSVALAIVAALGTGGAGAQSLRCNSDLASVGDSAITIFQKCGPPAFKSEPYCKRVPLQVPQVYGQLQYPGAPGKGDRVPALHHYRGVDVQPGIRPVLDDVPVRERPGSGHRLRRPHSLNPSTARLEMLQPSGFTYVWTRCCPGLRVHPSPKKCS